MPQSAPTDPMNFELRRIETHTVEGRTNPANDPWVTISEYRATTPGWQEKTTRQCLASVVSRIQKKTLAVRFPPFHPPAISEPGCWNVEGDLSFANRHPLSWDYLSSESPNHWLKEAQKQVYLGRIDEHLQSLDSNACVLEVGGGIGRFSVEWLRRGLHVTHTDPNEQALSLALGHLSNVDDAFSIWNLSAESLAPLADNSFTLVNAMEVFCYLTHPIAGLREAARVLRPNGTLVLSVETTPNDANSGPLDLQQGPRSHGKAHDLWVHQYTRQQLQEQLEEAGLEVLSIQGVHYLLDGPHAEQVDFDRLHDPIYRQELVVRDEGMDDGRHGSPRALLGIANKPAAG